MPSAIQWKQEEGHSKAVLTLPFKILAIAGATGAIGAVVALAIMASPPGNRPAAPAPTPPAASAAAPAPVPPASPAPSPAPAPAPTAEDETTRPRFDVVRVEPGGDVVVAGRAAPGATVDLLVGGARYDRAIADLGGQFAIVPRPLAPGQHELSLRATSPEGASRDSRQVVTVIVQDRKAQAALVALAEPERPTTLLQVPPQVSVPLPPPPAPLIMAAPAPAPPSPPVTAPAQRPPAPAPKAAVEAPPPAVPVPPAPRDPVRVSSVEADEAGRFYASGKASPGASVRLYLNNAFLGTAHAALDGAWSFTILRGLTAGRYDVRLDDVEATTGKVLSRAEVPFQMAARAEPPSPATGPQTPAQPVAASPPAVEPPAAAPVAAPPPREVPATAPQPARQPEVSAVASAPATDAVRVPLPPSPSAVVIADVRSETVRRGDSLWRISRRIYGQGIRYTTIFAANTDQIRDPALIYPGQIFVLPKDVPATGEPAAGRRAAQPG